MTPFTPFSLILAGCRHSGVPWLASTTEIGNHALGGPLGKFPLAPNREQAFTLQGMAAVHIFKNGNVAVPTVSPRIALSPKKTLRVIAPFARLW
jgi:hypothetical protein